MRLGIGSLRLEGPGLESPDGNQQFFVDGGFAEMVDNQLTVFTEQAIASTDLDRATIQAELTAAQNLPAHTPAEVAQRDRELERAKAKVKLVTV